MPHIPEHLVEAFEKLPEDIVDAQRITLSWPIAAYARIAGSITIEDLRFGTRCTAGKLLDVGGLASTGRDGTVELSLNDFHCLDVRPDAGDNAMSYGHPVNVVATVRGGRPALLTVDTRIGPGSDGRPQDVFITVSSWDGSGASLGSVPFAWRCLVPADPGGIIG